MTDQPRIAFLGIGLMGRPMAIRLINAGYPLTVWNRSPEKARALAGQAEVADSAARAVAGAGRVISMLENGEAVHQVLFEHGVAEAIRPGAAFIDMSSIAPEAAKAHARTLQARGVGYIDAPVSGGTVGAEQGTLSIMAGGDARDLDGVRGLLETLGRVTHIGPAGSGQLAKLANQAIVGITIGAVSEALLLAAKGGANPQAVREALLGGFAGSRILELHGQRMLERNFQPGGPARIQLKDMRMILDQARTQDLTLPLVQQALQSYRSLIALGGGEYDHSALLLQLEHLNQTRLNDVSDSQER